jgi:5'-nucleotidase
MHILVCNDDGIDAPGIYAVGHAITMQSPLRVVEFRKDGEFFGYAVKGTPADAVKLGVKCLLKEPVDLLVSGINHGSNTAINIIYSGTVSAATEGTVLGIPSIAMSLTTYEQFDFGVAARFAKKLALEVQNHGLPVGTLLNVNVPALPESEIRGVKITKQGISSWADTFDKRCDPSGREYYWLTGKMDVTDTDPETDQLAIQDGYISITPVHYHLTDEVQRKMMGGWKLA